VGLPFESDKTPNPVEQSVKCLLRSSHGKVARRTSNMFKTWTNPFYSQEDNISGADVEEEEEYTEDDSIYDEEDSESDSESNTSVPLAVVLREKAKRKELERKLKEYEEKEHEKIVVAEKETIKEKYVKAGYSEALADVLAEERVQTNAEIKRLKEDLTTREFKSELKEIAKDKFFSDIEEFAVEIKQKMKEVKGLSAEEAYILVNRKSATKRKMKEIQTDDEQLAAIERRKTLINQPTSRGNAGNNVASKSLDKDDLKALKVLQQMQPDAKWSAKKYLETIKKK